ncbi:hypothetical protein [Microbulbifer sp.]|uniref:hypothetical protein n=1 Tax=Microbulbifer sp. TaxID=1908541 RepID=UPI003F2F73F3
MRTTLRILAAASLAAVTFNSFAATDGTVGSSNSSGNFDITLTVPTQIIVKNFDDMALNTTGATLGNPIEGTEDICVGGIGFGNYSVSLSSQNGSTGGSGTDPFQLNGVGQNLPYSAAFINNTSSTTGTAADTNGDITGSFARNGNLDCDTDNARVFVTIGATEWESAVETSYSDTLTVTVTAL